MANAYEALIGAIFLDLGLPAARKFILRHLIPHFQEILDQKLYQDPKSVFQERSQEIDGITPRYKILKEVGPDHNKHFTVGVYLGKELVAEGGGSSKQEAETSAAHEALKRKQWS
jgi:ribonuclease-3